jgi:hypothetical protein
MILSRQFKTEVDRGSLRFPHSPLIPPRGLTEEDPWTEGVLRKSLSPVRARTLSLRAQRLSSRTYHCTMREPSDSGWRP